MDIPQHLALPFGSENSRPCTACVFNARSLSNKLNELHQLLYCKKYDVTCVTETWLHDGITNGLLDPNSTYSILRKDRVTCHGGGVAVFVARHLHFVEVIVDQPFMDLELLCFDLLISTCKLRFFVIYRPPYHDLAATKYVDLLITCLEQHCSSNYVNIVVGDFNCPNITWADHSAPNDYVSQSVLNWTVNCGFVQYQVKSSLLNNKGPEGL